MAAALVATTGAFAKKVKIQVDMTGQTISANGVHVAGNFQGWSPSATALTKEGSTDLYSTVVDINAMQVIEYKFINDNNWDLQLIYKKLLLSAQMVFMLQVISKENTTTHLAIGNQTNQE